MLYTIPYASPLGGLWLAADDRGVTGVWFAGEKYFPNWRGVCRKGRANPRQRGAERGRGM